MQLSRKILLALLIVFILIQFIPRSINKSNQILSTDFTKIYSVPDEVESIFKEACYDCHSNNTHYPWYSNIQPFRLWLDQHVKKGKEELNFSEYGSYNLRRQYNKLNSIAESLKKGTMPLNSYRWIHAKARLSSNQKETIMQWVSDTQNSLKTKK
jgi:hypothetical protein